MDEDASNGQSILGERVKGRFYPNGQLARPTPQIMDNRLAGVMAQAHLQFPSSASYSSATTFVVFLPHSIYAMTHPNLGLSQEISVLYCEYIFHKMAGLIDREHEALPYTTLVIISPRPYPSLYSPLVPDHDFFSQTASVHLHVSTWIHSHKHIYRDRV